MNNIIILAAVALISNLPLGYVRAPCKKFSFKWFLYIHLSIPFLILLRMHFGIGIVIIPMTITLAVIGQIIGAKFYKKRFKEEKSKN